ncbi:hypothetical protein EJ07DRAFT_155598 [Lizonia empirigonia]|nr:hypothetical protein EJ07DRAFT_155598 [Lizonia empirigonia]
MPPKKKVRRVARPLQPLKTARGYYERAWRSVIERQRPNWNKNTVRTNLTWLWESRTQAEEDECERLVEATSTALPTIDETILPTLSVGKHTAIHPRAAHRAADVRTVTPAMVTSPVNTTRFYFWPQDSAVQVQLPSDDDLDDEDRWLDGALLHPEENDDEWFGACVLGRVSGQVGMWVKLDSSGRVIDRMAVKDIKFLGTRNAWKTKADTSTSPNIEGTDSVCRRGNIVSTTMSPISKVWLALYPITQKYDACIFLRDGAGREMQNDRDWRPILHRDLHLHNVFLQPQEKEDAVPLPNDELNLFSNQYVEDPVDFRAANRVDMFEEESWPTIVLADYDCAMFDLQGPADLYADNPIDYVLDQTVQVSENPKLTRYPPEFFLDHDCYKNEPWPKLNSSSDVFGIGIYFYTEMLNALSNNQSWQQTNQIKSSPANGPTVGSMMWNLLNNGATDDFCAPPQEHSTMIFQIPLHASWLEHIQYTVEMSKSGRTLAWAKMRRDLS